MVHPTPASSLQTVLAVIDLPGSVDDALTYVWDSQTIWFDARESIVMPFGALVKSCSNISYFRYAGYLVH